MGTGSVKDRPPRDVAGQAAWWRLNQRTSLRWRADGVPLDNIEKTLVWAEGRERLPAGFRAKINEIQGGGEEPSGNGDARDWEEFELAIRTDETDQGHNPKAALAKISKARDWAYFKLEKAAHASDKKNEKFYGDLLGKMEGVLHDALLRAKRLGIDEGELLPRPEIERVIFSIAFWLLRSTDQHLDALTSKLKALAPELAGEHVRRILEGELLSARFLEPFARAAKIQAGIQIPEWVCQKMKEACGDFLSKGEARFDEESRKP